MSIEAFSADIFLFSSFCFVFYVVVNGVGVGDEVVAAVVIGGGTGGDGVVVVVVVVVLTSYCMNPLKESPIYVRMISI